MNYNTDPNTGRYLPTHGMKQHPLYNTWKNMMDRVANPKSKDYKYYGARGIQLFEEWRSIKTFIEWADSSGYKQGLTLDRINNDGNYEPSNCRWSTRREQSWNSRRSKLTIDKAEAIRAECRTRSYSEYDRLATKFGVGRGTIMRVVSGRAWVKESGNKPV